MDSTMLVVVVMFGLVVVGGLYVYTKQQQAIADASKRSGYEKIGAGVGAIANLFKF